MWMPVFQFFTESFRFQQCHENKQNLTSLKLFLHCTEDVYNPKNATYGVCSLLR